MIFDIESEVTMKRIGVMTHKHTQEFKDDSNVFERLYEYRQYMKKAFPNCDSFKLISAKERKG